MKRFLNACLFLVTLFLLLGLAPRANAYSSNSDIECRVLSVFELGNIKSIRLEIKNESGNDYSLGWVNGASITINTDEGRFVKEVSSGKLKYGTNTYTYTFTLPGDIKSMSLNGIIPLDYRGLPVGSNVTGSSIPIDLSSYRIINGLAIGIVLLISAIAIGFILFIAKPRVSRVFGHIFFIGGVITLIYSGYSFVVKPILGSNDFWAVSQGYWFLWILGMVLVAIGNSLKHKGKGRRHNKHRGHSTSSLNQELINQQNMMNQQNMINQENMRLFNEQMQRDMDTSQRAMNQHMDDMNQFQQQNDMNNFNNFNNMF